VSLEWLWTFLLMPYRQPSRQRMEAAPPLPAMALRDSNRNRRQQQLATRCRQQCSANLRQLIAHEALMARSRSICICLTIIHCSVLKTRWYEPHFTLQPAASLGGDTAGQLVEVKFMPRTAARKDYTLFIMCDSWIGADRVVPLKLKARSCFK
jgi:hypothetical protein